MVALAGSVSGCPYLRDNAGIIHRLRIDNGVAHWWKGNASWPPAGYTAECADQLIVRQGEVFCLSNGAIWKLWNAVSVYNTDLPPAWTTPGGGTPQPTPDPTPSTVAPGSSGRVVMAGPTRALKSLSEAIPTALAGDTVQLDPGNYTDTPHAWGVPLLIDLGGATLDATGQTATLARGKALLCPAADSIIQNGTITGVAMDQTSGQLTSAIRPDDGCGYLTVRNMRLHGNQCGVGHGGFPIVITVSDSDISGNGLLPGTNQGSLTHNLYVQGQRLILTNVVSTAPNEAHAIKSRARELVINGGTFASDVGSCIDLPDGTAKPFQISNATFKKSAGAVDHHVMGYAEESAGNGAIGGTITGGRIEALCDHPFITGSGTITASGVTLAGNVVEATGGIALRGFPDDAVTPPPPPPPPAGSVTIQVANAPDWAPNTSYAVGSRVLAGGYLWALEGLGGTSGATAPSAQAPTTANVGGGFDGTAPPGWASATTAIDNGLTWRCLTKVDFSSFTAAMSDNTAWPHQIGQQIQFDNPVTIIVWYGGVARPVYQAGKHGEADPIPMQDHIDLVNDQAPQCMTGGNATDGCNGMFAPNFWFVCAGPGDSHADHRVAGWDRDRTVRVDPSLGVTFFSDSPGNENPGTGAPIGFSDSMGTFTGIQFHSKNWLVAAAHGFYLPGHGHCNAVMCNRCIMQSDSGPGVISVGGWSFQDSAIIYLGSTPGAFGVISGYGCDVTRTMFVGSGNAPWSTALVQQAQFFNVERSLRDCDFSGFDHDWAFGTGQTINVTASGNTTNLPASYTGSTISLSLPNFGSNFTAAPVPGRVGS